MKVRYFVIKGKNQFPPIYLRFWNGRQFDQKAKTGLSVNIDSWNNAKQQVRSKADETQKDFINSKLRDLEKYVIEAYNIEYNSKQYIGKDWLKSKIEMFFGRASTDEQYKIYFIDWVTKFIDEAPKRLYKGKPINQKTIQQYAVTQKKLQAFEEAYKTKIRFEDVDLRFYRNFVDYCRTVERLGDNSISGHIKNIKMWCKNIEIDGWPINLQYKSSEFSTIKTETQDVYLSNKEIDKIFNHDFKTNLRLSNARNHFIFALQTGLRVSDFLKLKEKQIGEKYITLTTTKTNQKVVIPIHKQVKSILDNNNGELPSALSDQKFNEYVKEVCEAVGITQMVEGAKITKIILKEKTETTPEEAIHRKEKGIFRKCELISAHTGRRSFATNLYGKLPNKVIMAITGHKTETEFLGYIKTSNEEFAEILGDFWNKETTKEPAENNNMRVI
jgi:integrase